MQRRILTVGLLFLCLTLSVLATPGAKATRAASSLAIVVTGLLTVIAAPLLARLAG